MALTKQLRVALENQPGALAELCSELAKRAVNISGIHAADGQPHVQVRLIVSQLDTAKKVCDALHLKYAEEEVLAVNVGDRPGSLGRITRKLAEKSINIEYLYGTIERGAKRALIVLGVSNPEAAARVVR